MIIDGRSHLDHGLTLEQVDFIRVRFAERDSFFVETIELPSTLGTVPCGLYGPIMGGEPVSESDVTYAIRGNRVGKSRLVKRPLQPTNKVTVIAGPDGADKCVLYTAYSGPLAPREPFDTDLKTEEAKRESILFWTQHALSDQA